MVTLSTYNTGVPLRKVKSCKLQLLPERSQAVLHSCCMARNPRSIGPRVKDARSYERELRRTFLNPIFSSAAGAAAAGDFPWGGVVDRVGRDRGPTVAAI